MSTGCLQLSCQIFAGVANQGCPVFSRDNFQGEQIIYDTSMSDLINNYGINVNYYVNTYNLTSADNFYGEQPYKRYSDPVPLRMYVQVSDNAITLQKFGFVSDEEFTGYVHINTFYNTLCAYNYNIPNNQRIEPKSGDVIELTDLGYCRPGNRGPRLYEVTERVDQDFNTINPLLGTYVWRLKGKRFEYSFEPGLSGEKGNNQVADNALSGKVYDFNVDDQSKDKVFDMTQNNTDIYGQYY